MKNKSLVIKVSICCVGFLAFIFVLNKIGSPYIEALFAPESNTVMYQKDEKNRVNKTDPLKIMIEILQFIKEEGYSDI